MRHLIVWNPFRSISILTKSTTLKVTTKQTEKEGRHTNVPSLTLDGVKHFRVSKFIQTFAPFFLLRAPSKALIQSFGLVESLDARLSSASQCSESASDIYYALISSPVIQFSKSSSNADLNLLVTLDADKRS